MKKKRKKVAGPLQRKKTEEEAERRKVSGSSQFPRVAKKSRGLGHPPDLFARDAGRLRIDIRTLEFSIARVFNENEANA